MTDDNIDSGRSIDTTTEERNVTVTRVIDASPERLYEAFTDPDEMAAWFPPTGFSADVHRFEPEVGGEFRLTFTADADDIEPNSHTFGGTFLELEPSERIVYTDQFESDDPGMAGEMTVTVTFEAAPDGTEVTVHQESIPEAIPVDDARAGLTDSLGNLANLVEN
ncbi:hypothetical protein E6P09_17910 (plasmid) [Haloferax mediterranei ATCC 33500]|uniref:Activator of Hsp90 ATPase homologue 1/2-like C-terminal domain-containing protein n=1 Tax=Haloferax mediterranei (strain ATCC 33500 / DSM 1411 / JCM 8866 / NBRC 14739 / NCIMB 2177 / R-4) TaxID=523841 RepID=I3R9X6_HALMT|nr:SRPBCC domain-containing protein [Haloferax mediterranei]AFK21036.1 hypothetical protein HFX_5202 [Haloferax mediterranei ATCC 33500]AHZ24103.1 hypothetical protein BM92_18015 [Haloferax mediterranei ATCC 33500]EMA05178.1 hypothetical protein C439_00225 [Haloferax mediterranei ATCC 33500]MDX5989747.1 SRPBCC domain-containing protein [Haloferax mediterranei ATCC 33500]QCQ77197.1 hypothetical protein E6P09_17910 [Haloferax mediterranei ATCC 33500]